MSSEERDRAFLVREAVACRLGQREASERLGTACASSNALCVPGNMTETPVLSPISGAGHRIIA